MLTVLFVFASPANAAVPTSDEEITPTVPADQAMEPQKQAEDDDSGAHARPHATRYLLTSSAYTMGRGHGSLSQRELVLTDAAVGVSDRVDLSLGAFLPAYEDSVNVTGGIKAVVHQRLGLSLAVGARGGNFFDLVGGTAYAVGTVGTTERNVSVSGGVFLPRSDVPGYGMYMVSIGGVRPLGEHWALVSDNVALWNAETYFLAGSAAARWSGDHLWADVGVFTPLSSEWDNEPTDYVLPVFNVGWDFGDAE